MIKLAKQLEQSEKHRKKLDVQMQNIKKDLFKEVNTLNVSMNTRMDQLTTSLEAVEKYMWRQNVLQGPGHYYQNDCFCCCWWCWWWKLAIRHVRR